MDRRHPRPERPTHRPGWLLVGLVLVTLAPSSLLARQGEPPRSWDDEATVQPLEALVPISLPAVDGDLLRAEDAAAPQPGPLRFARPTPLRIDPSSDGMWESLAAGGRLWRVRVEVPGASDINLGFSAFRLPPGATLHLASEAEAYYEGPFTHADNRPHGQLWTAPVPGSAATLELFVPADASFDAELVLDQVGAGYRDLFSRESDRGPFAKDHGACNIDVVCELGDRYRDQIRAVAGYSFGGSLFCTGTLIADVPGSGRPFFLTANHCGLSSGNAASLVVFWNFQAANCGDQDGGSLADNQSGATFRASRADVDMALVELDATPRASFDAFYAGWDRSGNVPGGSIAIHHPQGDVKSISLNATPLTTGGSCIGSSPPDSHWYVDDWERGTTEPGSSGSPLIHRASKRVVGFLSGGLASCQNTAGFDCYGRFSEAWDGSSSRRRLRDWLDPNGNGPQRIDGFDAAGGGGPGPGCTETLGNGRYCTACGPCGAGEGDCDNDGECQAGLSCTDNIGAQFGFAPGIDVCMAQGGNPPPPPPPGSCPVSAGNGRFCTDCGPCGAGEGDCDNDGECQAGLSCTDNIGAQFGFAPGVDVCTAQGGNPPPPGNCPVSAGNGRFCTDCGPCGAGEGDCDNDGECQAGLSCTDNIGAQFGFAPGVDVCTAQGGSCPVSDGAGNFCDVCGPCGNGQGDCDADSDCQAGLVCTLDIGAQFGFAPGVDVCVPGS